MTSSETESDTRPKLDYEIKHEIEIDFSYARRIREIEKRLKDIENREYLIAGPVFVGLVVLLHEAGDIITPALLTLGLWIYLHLRYKKEREFCRDGLPGLRKRHELQNKFLLNLKEKGF
jgi:hypothetical protein